MYKGEERLINLDVLETKNQWARDDPAFLVLLASMLCCTCVYCDKEHQINFHYVLY